MGRKRRREGEREKLWKGMKKEGKRKRKRKEKREKLFQTSSVTKKVTH